MRGSAHALNLGEVESPRSLRARTHGHGANDCDKIKIAIPVSRPAGTTRVIVVPVQKRPSLMTVDSVNDLATSITVNFGVL